MLVFFIRFVYILRLFAGYFPKVGMLSGGAGDLFFGMLNASCCALGFRMFYNRDILSANLVRRVLDVQMHFFRSFMPQYSFSTVIRDRSAVFCFVNMNI